MTINIYLSGATVFIDDNINSEKLEINQFYYQVNEPKNTVAITDSFRDLTRTYSTAVIADETGSTIGTSDDVRVYLASLQRNVKVISGGGGGGGTATDENQLIQISETEQNTISTNRNTQLLSELLEEQKKTNKLLRKIYNPK